MMTTTCRILWIPVSGAILILTVADAAPSVLTDAGTIARHCSVRPVVNMCATEKLALRFSRGRATVSQRGPTRRSSDTTCPARPGSSSPLRVSASPAMAKVAVLDSVTVGRTCSATVRLFSPGAVTSQLRFVATEPGDIRKL